MEGYWFAYIGMMSPGAHGEIRRFRCARDGTLEPAGSTPAFESPSWFVSRGRVLYAASDSPDGAVVAYGVQEDGGLVLKNVLPAEGSSTCQLALDAGGRHVYAANYDSGSLTCFAAGEGGELRERLFTLAHVGRSVNTARQASPHVHCLAFTPDNAWLCAADLGTDRIELYRHGGLTGMLEHDAARAVTLPPGLGPRHIVFHPDCRHAYVVCELGNVVLSMRYDNAGGFRLFQQLSTLPEGWAGESWASAIRLSGDGRFLYASNRGHDSIACYSVSPEGGLEIFDIVPSGGRWPRDILFDPSARFLYVANQQSGVVTRFNVDEKTGALRRSVGFDTAVPHCSCIHFLRV